ncbi:MAG TPA: hypothetical protein ENN33_09510 [Ignavibacteria bacterium]|nr:hypothetical protein [Ignavibacteria bacterium]
MLKLTITSFSYRSGIPEDKNGNGGGYVFDCRLLHNPGRYDEFLNLTGKDPEVMDFLKKNSEADKFIKDVKRIIYRSITAYKRNNYTNLMINFGCTGGRHRSVYCAERIANRLMYESGIEVELIHTELEKENKQ